MRASEFRNAMRHRYYHVEADATVQSACAYQLLYRLRNGSGRGVRTLRGEEGEGHMRRKRCHNEAHKKHRRLKSRGA